MGPIMAYTAQNTQAVKTGQRRAPGVQRDDMVNLPGIDTAYLTPPVGRAQLRQPKQRPLAGGVDLTPQTAGHVPSCSLARLQPADRHVTVPVSLTILSAGN